jgi:hypothetical protein
MVWRISKTNRNSLEPWGRDSGSPMLLLGGVSNAHFSAFLRLAVVPAGPCLLPNLSVFLEIIYGSIVPAARVSGERARMEIGRECILDLF